MAALAASVRLLGEHDGWSIGNDLVVRVERLTNPLTDELIQDATVTASLVDDEGEVVHNCTVTNLAGGDYQIVIPSSVALTQGEPYSLNIVAAAGSVRQAWTMTRRAMPG